MRVWLISATIISFVIAMFVHAICRDEDGINYGKK